MAYKARFVTVFSLLIGLSPALAFGAKFESAGFYGALGALSYGSRYSFSPSFEANGNVQEISVSTCVSDGGGFSGRSGILAAYPQPSSVNDFESVIASTYSMRFTWTAPSGNWYRGNGSAAGYILRYSTTAPLYTDGGFLAASPAAQDWTPLGFAAGETRILEGFNPGTTYYFSLESYNGDLIRSEMSNLASALALTPLAPMNFKITATPTSVAMSWIAPTGFSNRIPFNDRYYPAYPYEVKGYQVFRATAPANAVWESLTPEISSDIFNWTDVVDPGQRFYYQVRAFNQAGIGSPSYSMANEGGAIYFVAPDNTSLLEVPADGISSFVPASGDPLTAYTVEITSHAEDLAGRVVKSLEFAAYKGGLKKDAAFKLPKMGTLRLYYRAVGGTVVPSRSSEKNLSMYFYNGAKWTQLYGKINEADKNIELRTTLLGRYQIREVERSGGFGADSSGLSNRLITPNGDGKNDSMVFVFDNPVDVSVKGIIYDLKGARVAKMVPGPISNSLVWDAKAGGQTVPGGVYIYQIESAGKAYNGTVAVIR